MEQKTLSELLSLSGKTAIVTGGAMGIGRGIADRLHEAGANIVIADHNGDAGGKTAHELNLRREGSAVSTVVDVSREDEVVAVVALTTQRFGSIDILVNNAGIFPFVPLASMKESDFMRVIDVNLRGVFLMTKHISEVMKQRGKGGVIVNVTSIDAIHPSMIGLAHYDASKHGVWGFTKNVALELAPHGIRVNALAPGGIVTPGTGLTDQTTMEKFAASIPLKRLGDPDEMGRIALFLASELSSYMTGSQVVADGGALLG